MSFLKDPAPWVFLGCIAIMLFVLWWTGPTKAWTGPVQLIVRNEIINVPGQERLVGPTEGIYLLWKGDKILGARWKPGRGEYRYNPPLHQTELGQRMTIQLVSGQSVHVQWHCDC